MKVGDLIKHPIFGIGLIYQINHMAGDSAYWKAASIYNTKDLAMCYWNYERILDLKPRVIINSWVPQCILKRL